MKEWLKKYFFLASAIAAGAILRLCRLDYQSIWLDEIHTVAEANPDFTFAELNSNIMMGEQMPPLYFYIIYILFKIFGHSLFIARAFSAVLGIVSIYAIYKLGEALADKRAGIFCAWLLAVNSFHLYYSQEARSYCFFFLFTTLSLYYLVRFLQKPNWANIVYYGIFSALMLYGHFFGLLALFAQYLILLGFLIADKENLKSNFIKVTASFGIIILLFFPAFKFLLSTSRIEQFWLPPPGEDAFTNIFKAFTGNNELLTIVFSLLIILFFVRQTDLYPTNTNLKRNENAEKVNMIFSCGASLPFILSIVWIVVIISIPLIKSYISTPVILDRYFINILPVMIIMAGLGINSIKGNAAKTVLLVATCILSIINIFFIKQYYTTVNKTQFREAAAFVINKKKQHYPVVTRLSWHMQYFFQNKEVNYQIIGKPIEEYLADLKQDTTKIQAFWYVDGHSKPYSFSAEDKAFLDKHFILEESYDGFNIYSKLFLPIKEAENAIDVSKFGALKAVNGDEIYYSIENFSFTEDILTIKGYSFFQNTGTESTKTRIVLVKDNEIINLGVANAKREDVSEYFKNKYNFDDSGFELTKTLKFLEKGNYRVGLYMIDNEKGKEGLVLTDKEIHIK